MTVQELIDELNKVEDKSIDVFVRKTTMGTWELDGVKIMKAKKRQLYTANYIDIETGVVLK